MTLSVDSGAGVNVESWISNGTDFLEAWSASYKDFRLYPTTLQYTSGNMIYVKYHFAPYPYPKSVPADTRVMPWPSFNEQWQGMEKNVYDGKTTDAFTVGFDPENKVVSLESLGLRCVMYRK